MKTNSVLEKLIRFKEGDITALEEIIMQMSPLVKKYAYKIHFMEFDDASQELYMTLIESVKYLTVDKTEMQILKYINLSVIRKYCYLCKKYLSRPELLSLDVEINHDLGTITQDFDNLLTNLDFINYISKITSEDQTKGSILKLYFFYDLTDIEISGKLHISRQCVNRIRKKLITNFLNENDFI